MKTRTVYHPTLPTPREVPERDAQAWKDQGWRFTPPKDDAEKSSDQ